MKVRTAEKYNLASNFLWMLRCIREFDPKLFAWIAMNALSAALSNMAPIIFPKLIIDELTVGGSTNKVIMLAVAFGAALFITGGITGISYGYEFIPSGSMSIRFIALRIKFHAKQNLKVMQMDYQKLEDPEILDKFNRAERALSGNFEGLEGMSRQVLTMFRSLLTVLGTVAVVAIMGHWLLLLTIGLLFVNYAVTTFVQKRDKEIYDALAPTNRKIQYIENMSSSFSYGKDIRIFGFKNFIIDKLRHEKNIFFSANKKRSRLALFNSFSGSLTTLIQETAMYAWLCWRVLLGVINIGSFLMYITSIRTFSSALNDLLSGFVSLQRQSRVISDHREFDDLQDMPCGTQSPSVPVRTNGGIIEFDNVSFKYPGSDTYALKNMSFTVGLHEKLAVVGLNGAGKSTFIKLLMRLYVPESGRILLDGVDILTYDRDDYFKLFSAVFQEINVFAFSVAENVSMCEIEKTDLDRVVNALEMAGLSEKIASLPKGINTAMLKNLELDGVEFSGGETQKLALARALYKNAPFIVLDEPTAALDALAEERLYNEFNRLSEGKTAIYISHRLASTRFCDRILLFEDGVLAESGSHSELLEYGGKYAELFAVQAQYYKKAAEPEREDMI